MTRALISVGLGLAVGLGCGWACQQWLAKRPFVQSIVAVVSAWLLASIVSGVLWLLDPAMDADVLAVTFGFTEAALTTVMIAVLAAVLHFASEWSGVPFAILGWRPVVLGLIGGAFGAASVAFELGFVRPLH